MNRHAKARLLLILVALGAAAVTASGQTGEPAPDPKLPYQGERSKPITYQVDFSAVVTPPYKCKVLKIWMTMHRYTADAPIRNPFQTYDSLEK